MFTKRLLELIGLPLLWGALVYGAISLRELRFGSDHSICGPWGCGPTTPSLLAMHVGWLALLAPPFLVLPKRIGLGHKAIQRLSSAIALEGLSGVFAIIAWQWIIWLPQADEWSKQYIWQRCGFAVATAVDFPLLQLTAIGIALRLLNNQSNKLRTTTAFESIESSLTSNELHAAPTTSLD